MRRHRIPRAAAVLLSTRSWPRRAVTTRRPSSATRETICARRWRTSRTSTWSRRDPRRSTRRSDVEESVRSLRDAAQEEYEGEISAVEDAWDQLDQAVSTLGNQPSASAAMEAVGDSLAELAAATETLVDSLSEECE